MNIFVIHKSNDQNIVTALIERIKSKVESANFLILTDGNDNWKKEAKIKIKTADCVLVALGEHTCESKNVDYEINLAKKYGKRIFLIRLSDKQQHKLNDSLFFNDKFMEVKYHKHFLPNKRPLFKEINEDDFVKLTTDGFDFDLQEEINKTKEPKRIEELIEQYKFYLETSENVVNRRQNASSFYIAINTALISLLTTVTGILVGLAGINNKLMVISVVVFSIAILGLVLCSNWYYLIDSYGKLNSAKMKVISALEKLLPANIYDTEWRVMNEKVGNTRYRPFTNIEKKVPLTFLMLYGIITVLSIAAFVISLIF
jgi:hypothetical protein